MNLQAKAPLLNDLILDGLKGASLLFGRWDRRNEIQWSAERGNDQCWN